MCFVVLVVVAVFVVVAAAAAAAAVIVVLLCVCRACARGCVSRKWHVGYLVKTFPPFCFEPHLVSCRDSKCFCGAELNGYIPVWFLVPPAEDL